MRTRFEILTKGFSILPTILFVGSTLSPAGLALAKTEVKTSSKPAVLISKIVEKIEDHFDKFKHSHPDHRGHEKCDPRGPASQTPPAGICSKSFEKRVHAVKITPNHIYLNMNDLDFLNSSNGFRLTDVELEIWVKGQVARTESFHLSMNGIKVFKRGGNLTLSSGFEYNRGHNLSRGLFKLHDLLLNGSESFDQFLQRLKRNKGVLKISLHGHNPKMTDAYVTFKGILYFPCNTPPSSTTTTQPQGTTTTTTTLPNTGTTTTTTLPDTSTTTTTTTSTTSTTTSSTTTTTTLPPEDMSKYQAHIDSVNPTASPTSSGNMLIYFSTLNTDGTLWCSVDQKAFEKCVSPVSLTDLASGDHHFEVYAETPRGATGATDTYDWSVDRVAPVVTITNAADLPTLTNHASMTFLFASSKTGTFKCSLDGGTSSLCQSPWTLTTLSEGLHTFSVSAIDKVGNVSGTPAKFQWTLDLTPPTVSVLSVDPGAESSSSHYKNFSFAADETSNFECSVDHSGFGACQSPLELTELSEGQHSLEIRATDLAGNIGGISSSSWKTDYTAPGVALGTVTPAQGLTSATQVSVEFFLNETAQGYCQWDDQPAAACSSPWTMNHINDGPHQLSIFAIDSVGLKGESVSLSWTVDATSPMISFGSILPSAASFINATDITLPVNGSESVTLRASINGSVMDSLTNPIQLNQLPEGTYTVEVSGFDQAQNVSNTIQHTFTVDLTAPVLSLTSDGTALSNLDSRSFSFTSSEEAQFECSLDEAGFEACQSPRHLSGLADGDHQLIVRATDLAGNQSSASSSWTVDATAPQTSQTLAQQGNSATVTLSSSESNVSYICSLDSQMFESCTSPVTLIGLGIGTHTFASKAIDAAGNIDPVGASTTFKVLGPIHTSITASNPSADLVSSKTMSISFTADQPTSGFVCSLDGSTPAPCSSPATYGGLSEGSHFFVVKAVDTSGNTDNVGASKGWTVDTIAPVVGTFTTATTTNSITVTWTTNENSSAKVTYGVGSVLNQSTAEDMTMTTTHTVQLKGLSSNTVYSIQVSGRDAAGNVYTSTVKTVRTNR